MHNGPGLDLEFRTGRPGDAREMAELFLISFPQSVRAMFGRHPARPEAMADFYSFILRAEPGCVQTAREASGRLVGYAITPRHMPRLWLTAAVTGAWVPWVFRFLAGRYGVGLEAALRALSSKVAFARSFRPAYRAAAQVLSLAVAPDRRGRGIGRALLERGLGYLRRQGARRVKLEVLGGNDAAFALYRNLGFRAVGDVPYGDGGRWIVMLKDLDPPPGI